METMRGLCECVGVSLVRCSLNMLHVRNTHTTDINCERRGNPLNTAANHHYISDINFASVT